MRNTFYTINNRAESLGFSLVELIVAIVVISIGVTGFLYLINQTMRGSVDPLFRQQANAIAQAYLEEVSLRPFCDPNDFSSVTPCPCTTSACGTCGGAGVSVGESRPTFDDICDYDGLNEAATDQSGTPIANLSNYNVTVNVIDTGVLLGPAGSQLDSNFGSVVRIDVTATHTPSNTSSSLSTYRANY